MTKKKTESLKFKAYGAALYRTLKMAFRASPGAVALRIVDIIIGAILPVGLTVAAAATTTKLVDAFSGVPGAEQAVIWLVIITALLGMVQIIWSNVSGYVDRIIRYKVNLAISTQMFERFVQLDFWRYDDKATIETYEKASRFSSSFAYIFASIGSIVSSVVAVIVSVIALAYISPWISLMMCVAIIPGALLQIKMARQQAQHWTEHVSARREASYIEYNLLRPESIAELRIYKLAKYMLLRRKELIEIDERGNLGIERKYMKWELASSALLSVAEVVSLIWIVVLISSRQQPVGQFIFVQQMVSRALGAATGIASSLGSLDDDMANLADYDEFMSMPLQDLHSDQVGTLASIDINNVSFTYPGSTRTSLSDVSLSISAGQHIAIVGENGAGKTTFIKLLLGLYAPTSGTIAVNGKDLQSYDIESWHGKLAVLLQEFTKYQTSTIEDNIAFGDVSKRRTASSIAKATTQSESNEFIDKLSKKLKTPASNWFTDDDEEAAMLSGGQWQRIALARNFYRNAPLIILDEPTSAIDALAEAKIFKRLLTKQNNQTIVTISHRLTTVEKADIIYVFKDGSIAEQGTHRELVELSGEYARMFEDQLSHDS